MIQANRRAICGSGLRPEQLPSPWPPPRSMTLHTMPVAGSWSAWNPLMVIIGGYCLRPTEFGHGAGRGEPECQRKYHRLKKRTKMPLFILAKTGIPAFRTAPPSTRYFRK